MQAAAGQRLRAGSATANAYPPVPRQLSLPILRSCASRLPFSGDISRMYVLRAPDVRMTPPSVPSAMNVISTSDALSLMRAMAPALARQRAEAAQMTREASESTFISFRPRSSCVAKPSTRVPSGCALAFTSTHEFWWNLTMLPSRR